MEELSQPGDLGVIANRLRASLQKEFQVSTKTCLLQPIIASLAYTQRYPQPQEMFAAAEAALHSAEAEFAGLDPA